MATRRATKPRSDLDAALGNMPIAHVTCRDYGHAWTPHTARHLQGGKGYEQTLRCQRCDTRRDRYLDRYGDIVKSSYDYAEGYLVKGLGRLTGTDRGHIRLASIEATLRVHPDAEGRQSA